MRDVWVTVPSASTVELIAPMSGSSRVRAEVMVYNPGPTTVWVGNLGDGTSLGVSHGFPVVAESSITVAVINEGVYCRAASGTQVIYPLVEGVPA